MTPLSAVGLGAVLLVMAVGAPASAQSTNAKPDIIMGAGAFNPAKVSFLDDATRKLISGEIAKVKSRALTAFVFSMTPDRKGWGLTEATPKEFANLADLARRSLEACEFPYYRHCQILTISGHDARDANGDWPLQPSMLSYKPSEFDPWRVPFIPQVDRVKVGGYVRATNPRAFVVSIGGGWLWRGGRTVFAAVAAAEADCHKNFSNQRCVLYAIDDKVVMAE